MRLDFTFRLDDITVKGDLGAVRVTSQETITIRTTGGDATSASPAAVRSGTHGGDWTITQYMYQQLPEQSEGAAPASSEPPPGFGHVPHPLAVAEHDAGADGHVDLPARTGAGQVDVGVAGAVRVPALGAADAAGGNGSRPPMH